MQRNKLIKSWLEVKKLAKFLFAERPLNWADYEEGAYCLGSNRIAFVQGRAISRVCPRVLALG